MSQDTDDRVRLAVPFLRRVRVVAAGLALGAAFALFVAGPMTFSNTPMVERGFVWVAVMCGPIIGSVVGMLDTSVSLGWLGLLFILAHPVHPCDRTVCVTLFGFSLWYYAGFSLVMAGQHGG